MALMDLPESPAGRAVGWRLIDFGSTMPGGLGGPSQRINRNGNRWQVTIRLPRMDVSLAREWQAKLNAGIEADGVRMRVRQLGLHPGPSGSPVINGAAQSGKVLSLSGLTPGFVPQFGQYFSLITGGQRYGFKIAEPQRVAASGEATLAIEPALRVEPSDGDIAEFGKPYIEGKLIEVPVEETGVSTLAEGFEFTIAESR